MRFTRGAKEYFWVILRDQRWNNKCDWVNESSLHFFYQFSSGMFIKCDLEDIDRVYSCKVKIVDLGSL